MSDITWTTERRKIRDLIPWKRNPRQIKGEQVRRLQESVEEFGQFETIAVGPANEVYNGHQRLKSWGAKYGPDYEVEVRVSSRPLSEKEREKLTILAHKGAAGEWSWDDLANHFEVSDLLEWGFSEKELQLGGFDLDEPKGEDPGAQVDKAEELREKWNVQPGQLWQLGEHRLICGDSTDRAIVERVMGGEKADMVFTDPPYNIDYSDNVLGRSIANDKMGSGEYVCFLTNALLVLYEFTANSPAYVWFATSEAADVLSAVSNTEWAIKNWIIWSKDCGSRNMTADYRWMFEPALYLIKSREELPSFYGDRSREGNVWEIADPKSFAALTDKGERAMNKIEFNFHPNMKPKELAEKAIKNSCKDGGAVLDIFSGSGTTLIACERLSRKCRAVEISPAYVAVALQRWADMTGKTPVLIE